MDKRKKIVFATALIGLGAGIYFGVFRYLRQKKIFSPREKDQKYFEGQKLLSKQQILKVFQEIKSDLDLRQIIEQFR